MNAKLLNFLKKYFHKCGDRCPRIEIDKFIVENFNPNEREDVEKLINKLNDNKYFQMSEDNQYFVCTGYGAEMLKRNKLEVEE